ncbi:MAG: hypothetical protein KGJ86_04890, partial [Chloroflexota bacterium]|nr:hypothetical protein [Chloroflexota bacterium]
TSIRFEPAMALTDGADGLALFRALFKQIPGKLAPDGCALLEIGATQPGPLLELARAELPSFVAAVYADYAGLPRVLELGARAAVSACC